MLLKIALRSLLNRKTSVVLTLLSIALSVFVLLGVEHVRQEARDSFARTVSGVDLIVGARTSPLNLLLYSVFRIGNANSNISWQSYQKVAANPKVDWTIPISLGDSHRGYRVMGTSRAYFEHFRYGADSALSFQKGRAFDGVFDVVLGAEVARQLNYTIGQQIVLTHGLAKASFTKHEDKPFQVVGILQPTGTPVDQTLHVSLAGIEAIHIDWQQGVPMPGGKVSAAQALAMDLTPTQITAFMLRLNSKVATFRLQRQINSYRGEPLLAILPGVALAELWQMMGSMERILRLVSLLVLLAALIGMTTMLLASMRERRRELAVFRAVGASPWFIFFLIELEALLIALFGMLLGLFALSAVIALSQGYLSAEYGLFISADVFNQHNAVMMLAALCATFVVALVPAWNAYRCSMQTGLNRD